MIELHLLFGLLKPNLMDILFPSFCSWKYASLVTVDFYDFFPTWATTHLSLLNTSTLEHIISSFRNKSSKFPLNVFLFKYIIFWLW